MSPVVQQRFWEKVDQSKPNDCWLWKGAKYSNGYGLFHPTRYISRGAHRCSYYLKHGQVPAALHHICGVKLCVNPDHLVPTDHSHNAKEG